MKLKHLAIFFIILTVILILIKDDVVTEHNITKNDVITKNNEAIIKKNQTVFDELFEEVTYHGYGLNHDIDISKAILKLEKLIAQGANPNKKIAHGEGDSGNLDTPISYMFFICGNDAEANHTDGRNFYLEIIQLLIDSGVDWNAENIHESYYYDGTTTTIAETLKWVEEEKQHKPKCIEALDYVKNHLKENNITIEATKRAIIKKKQNLFDELFMEMTQYSHGLDYDIDIPNTILRLETLIEQGTNPNRKIDLGEGDYINLDTPISYVFLTCINDSRATPSNGRNFYLDIIKLLVESGVDWNAKNIYGHYYHGTTTTTIADRLKQTEENADKPKCIEAADYVKNHLKENNITLEE